MTTEQEMSLSEAVLIFGSLGSLVGMIWGCVVGFVGGLYELKAEKSKLKMENSHLKEELAENFKENSHLKKELAENFKENSHLKEELGECEEKYGELNEEWRGLS